MPEVILMPGMTEDAPDRLECRRGWTEETSKVFHEAKFDQLVLSGGDGQDFLVPDLGSKAREVLDLNIQALGEVSGIEQFANVQHLRITSMPRNGISLSVFPRLRGLTCEWERLLEKQVFSIETLRTLEIVKYDKVDCSSILSLPDLEVLSLTQGRVRSLQGSEDCSQLQDIHLHYIRNLSDIESIFHLKDIKNISMGNLPKLSGCLDFSGFKRIESLEITDVPVSVDLSFISDLGRMKLLWLNMASINVIWDAIFSNQDLRLVGIMEGARFTYPDEELHRLAEKHGRSIERLDRGGTKKNSQVRIKFRIQSG